MPTAASTKIECDALAVSGGWNPAVHLTCHLGGKPVWNEDARGIHARRAAARHACRRRGERRADARRLPLPAASRPASMAAVECGFAMPSIIVPSAEDEPAAITPLWHVKESRAKAFVDFQNDVTVERHRARRSRRLSARSSISSATRRSAWRPTRARSSNVTGLAILAELSGRTHPAGRHHDLSAALRAGELRRDGRPSSRPSDFRPIRLPPSHRWAAEQGAVFVEAGAVDARAILSARRREGLARNRQPRGQATRGSVGVCDVSTLGKIEIEGADAGDLPRPRLRQHALDARGRQGALRPDAARGRLRDGRRHHLAARAGSLLHDHARPRNAGARDAASGILPSGAVARRSTCRWCRSPSSGRSSRSRARARATCCASSSTRNSISATRPFRIWPRAK